MNTVIDKYARAKNFYLNSLRVSTYSPRTLIQYRTVLDMFGCYLEADGHKLCPNSGEISVEAVEGWKAEMAAKNITTKTIVYNMNGLRRFFEYVSDSTLADMRFYESCPVPRRIIPAARTEQDLTGYPGLASDGDILSLIGAPKPKTKRTQISWERDRAILIVLLTSGIRDKELRELAISDLDYDNSVLVVRNGKGKKTRYAPFPDIAQAAVRNYIRSEAFPSDAPDDAPLFGTFGGNEFGRNSEGIWQQCSVHYIYNRVKAYTRFVLGRELTVRDMRHTAASLFLRRGASLEDIQKVLGHSNPKTTQIYAERLSAMEHVGNINTLLNNMDFQAIRLASNG